METIGDLANYIIDEIEKEDFLYAIKHFGCFKVQTTAKKIKEWCEEID